MALFFIIKVVQKVEILSNPLFSAPNCDIIIKSINNLARRVHKNNEK